MPDVGDDLESDLLNRKRAQEKIGRENMKRELAHLLCVLLAIVVSGCSNSAQEKWKPAPRTASDIYRDMEKDRSAGRLDAALVLARELVSNYSGTPEAEKAASQIPELEAARKAAGEAERGRAAKAAAAVEAQRQKASDAIKQVRATIKVKVAIPTPTVGLLSGGIAVAFDDATYWVKDGVVYAGNGIAKTWSPNVPYAPQGVDYSTIKVATQK